ncbi:MAG: hypothetical protein R3C05_28355 [Pirellulaceae bacterium]
MSLLIVSGESKAASIGLADVCVTLKLPQANATNPETRMRAAIDWLNQQENRGWLIIIDNVDSKEMLETVVEQVRQFRRGSVVLTSRLARWPQGFIDLELDLIPGKPPLTFCWMRQPETAIPWMLKKGPGTDRMAAQAIAEDLGTWRWGWPRLPPPSTPSAVF